MPTDRLRMHVQPRPDGRWEVHREGAGRASFVTDSQSDAISRAAASARSSGHAQVVIHGRDGRVRDERTYGEDPYPPRG